MTLRLEIPNDDSTRQATQHVTTPSGFEELFKFSEIFDRHMPSSRKPISHESTAVLLLSFDSEAGGFENLGVKPEVDELEKVCKEDYGFTVENNIIRSISDAQIQANAYVSAFIQKYHKRHALLIIYYAGHGWRSNDVRRKPGFNLLSQKNKYRQPPSDGTFVMWEATEKLLHPTKCDVLVIFDCCDAGSLMHLRSGRAFEYLGACGEDKYTHGPSQKSFTSAMIWALKELRSVEAFTTETLRNKIKTFDTFPDEQEPVLFPRWETLPERIWISRMKSSAAPKARRKRSSTASEFRADDCSFVDVRLFFNKHLDSEDAEHLAKMMSPVVLDRTLAPNARHVSVLQKGTCELRPTKSAGDNWRKARRTILLVQRWKKQPEEEDDDATDTRPRKRPRTTFEDNAEDSSQLLEVIGVTQRPITPVSEDPSSDTESAYHLHVQPGLKTSPSALASPTAVYSDHANASRELRQSLESLENDLKLQTGLEGLLLRIQETKALLERRI